MYEVNQKTLAQALGISARQVRNLRDDGMFEFIKGSKKYDLTKCVQEYIEFKVKAETGRGTSVNREREMAEHEKIKKEISKLKLRRLRGEVHEAKDVEYFLTDMLMSFRNHLCALPARVAPELMGKSDVNEITELLTASVYETLGELCEYDAGAINGDGIDWDEEDDEDDEDVEDEAENMQNPD